MLNRFKCQLGLAIAVLAMTAAPASAQDRLCDPGNEDCRSILINLIRAETVGIDVGFWFMEDARYSNELIARWRAGVPVRVLMDTRANSSYPLNAERLAELRSAGIPMRRRLTSYILHWKMMLFHGQNVVEFSGANFSADAWRPGTATPYENYIDEAIYFTSDPPIVNSFRTKFDDHWVDTADWSNYANISGPLARHYGIFPKDASLNFPPSENYRTRSVNAYNAERRAIDVIMYRITDRAPADAMLAAVSRGVPARLITEPEQYRDPARMWHAWNVDRLYMGGVQIRHRAHQGLNHQKSVILYDQDGAPGDQSMVIFGSSNWTSPSATGQVEHNMFTMRFNMTSWFINQFERKWNNASGVLENVPFVPLPPDPPADPNPGVGAANIATGVQLTWSGGPWAHLYDVYLDTSPNPTMLIATNLQESSAKTATSRFSYTLPFALRAGTRYYWKVIGKTMAQQVRSSPVWSFTTGGARSCPGEASDFDGDCRADVTVFRPSNGTWYQLSSRTGTAATIQWGTPGDIPVPGDYDGDGRKDIAVYRPSTGMWYVLPTGGGGGMALQWGSSGDVPVAGDYDGDGRTDVAVFHPGSGVWYVRFTGSGRGTTVPWGAPGDVPVPGNYDGDRKADFVVFRQGTGTWYARLSTGLVTGTQWGAYGDVAVPGDYDGDGQTDLAVFRPASATWYARFSSSGGVGGWQWGTAGDRPVPGDFDGDGRTDVAVFRPSTGIWYIRFSSSGAIVGAQWGVASDIAVPERR